MKLRPMPTVGHKIWTDYPPGSGGHPNINNWTGEVRAIVDDQIVIRRWSKHRQGWVWELVSQIGWTVFGRDENMMSGKRVKRRDWKEETG